MTKLIAQGAEAHIFKKKGLLVKERRVKGYRLPELDIKLRTQRTRKEAKLLEKASSIINVPKIRGVTQDTLFLEEIKGKKIADIIDKSKEATKICKEIGRALAKLHDRDIIHGDLTTSNMIYNPAIKKLSIIDFGLGYNSSRIEDKAVDIHVFREALEARHPKKATHCYNAFKGGYSSSKNASLVMKQVEKVEMRGRYKTQY